MIIDTSSLKLIDSYHQHSDRMYAQKFVSQLRTLPRSTVRSAVAQRQAFVGRPLASSSIRFNSTTSTTSEAEAAGQASAEVDAAKKAYEEKIQELEAKVKELSVSHLGSPSTTPLTDPALQKDVLYGKAEAQTLTRRIGEEKAKASEFAITSFARSLLDTTDVLNVALKHVPKPVEPNTPLASLVSGVELTQKAMLKTFAEAGVVKMAVERGSTFDPNLHEATFQIPKEIAGPKGDGSEWQAGEVVEVGKEGWLIRNRVLRPAQVGVTQIE